MAKRRENTRQDDFQTLTQPEVGVSKTISATRQEI